MTITRKIDTAKWDEPDFAEYSADAKLLYFYLKYNRLCNQAGCYPIAIVTMSNATGLSRERVETALEEIKKEIIYYPQDKTVLIKGFTSEQALNDAFWRSAFALMKDIPTHIATQWIEHYKDNLVRLGLVPSVERGANEEFNGGLTGVKQGSNVGAAGVEGGNIVISNQESVSKRLAGDESPQVGKKTPLKKTGKTIDHDNPAYCLAKQLLLGILINNPHSKHHKLKPVEREKVLQNWAADNDLLIRKDGQTVELIEEVIAFATYDSFWGPNIMSGEALRAKWDTLVRRMEESRRKGVSSSQASRLAGESRVSRDAAGRALEYLA